MKNFFRTFLALAAVLMLLTGSVSAEHVHNWKATGSSDATCQKAGYQVYTCSICGQSFRQETGVKPHWYQNYIPDGDGEHTGACIYCGRTLTAPCKMISANVGNMEFSACGVCGYALSYGPEDVAVASLTEIPNAVIESVSRRKLEHGTRVVAFSVDPSLLGNSNISAAFVVSMFLYSEDATLDGIMGQVSFPWPHSIAGQKMVRIDPDGTVVDLEFRISAGKLVFNTGKMGLFALVPAA